LFSISFPQHALFVFGPSSGREGKQPGVEARGSDRLLSHVTGQVGLRIDVKEKQRDFGYEDSLTGIRTLKFVGGVPVVCSFAWHVHARIIDGGS